MLMAFSSRPVGQPQDLSFTRFSLFKSSSLEAIMTNIDDHNEYCMSCVYYPPNLPEHAYSEEDYQMLQSKNCSFDHVPHDDGCVITRKTSCSLVDLEEMKKTLTS